MWSSWLAIGLAHRNHKSESVGLTILIPSSRSVREHQKGIYRAPISMCPIIGEKDDQRIFWGGC